MVSKKYKSKRQTLAQKYKIKKRVKEHHKRIKKGVLVNTKNKLKKDDNRIPNDWPYKAELLQEIQQAKDRMEVVKQNQKQKRAELMVSVCTLL
jgi:nuclear GTP-binding protein